MKIYVLLYCFLILLFYISGRLWSIRGFNAVISYNPYTLRRKTQDKYFLLLSFAALIAVLGLRHPTMGVDLEGYLSSFKSLRHFSWQKVLSLDSFLNYEKGYIILNKLVGSVSSNAQFFLCVCAFLSLAPIGYVIYKHSADPLSSIIIYMGLPLLLIVFSGLRQAISIAVACLSIGCIKEKKPFRFVFVVLLASTLHSSALLFLPAYLLYEVRLNKKLAICSVILLPVVWVLRSSVFSTLMSIFLLNKKADNNGAITLFIVFTLIYLFCILFGNRDDKEINGMSNLFFVACFIQAIGGVYSTVIRVGYYYMVYLMLLLPRICCDMAEIYPRRQVQWIRIAILVCFLAYGYYAIRTGSWAESYPYRPFWQAYA